MESTSPAQLDTVSQPEAPAASRYSLRWLFFPLALLYHELLLRAFDSSTVFFDAALAPTALTALGLGLLISLLANALPCRRVSRWAALILTLLWTVCVCVEYCCKSYFKSYFALTFMVTMTGHVVGDFAGTIPDVVLPRLPFILLALVPPVLAIVLRRRIVPEGSMGRRGLLVLALLALLTLGGGDAVGRFGPSAALFTYDFNTNSAVPRFGLNTALRLELTYAVTGVPTPPLEPLPAPDPAPEPEPTPVDYGYNMLDIDFTALAESTGDSTLASLHRYMAARTPSRQNQYTGMFAGKNLILLTAESFSPWFISQELTPTLYRLTHEGFVFSNYYQPGWGQSTTGGEFAVLTGLLPTWVGGDVSFWASRYDYMPLALGNQFRALGYQTPAWHNNTYNYYGRNATHPNLGYDYEGIGSGLTLATQDSSWPYSDLEMLEATLDSCVDAYLTTGQPFHAYYMTVSGHMNYTFLGNSMAAKHRDEVADLDMSEAARAYLACNMELDQALEYTIKTLEEAGELENTVIVLSGDHYPYGLDGTGAIDELAGEGTEADPFEKYRSTLILWSGDMEEPVVVDKPCYSVDIIPTLSNLFGLEYDSRLLAGRDILSDAPGLVIFNDYSYLTELGRYNADTDTFTPNEGAQVPENYAQDTYWEARYIRSYSEKILFNDYYRKIGLEPPAGPEEN